MNELVASQPLERPEDVFALRQSGRLAAAAIGCDEAGQVRFATALSEVGREILAHRGRAAASFFLESNGALLVSIDAFPRAALPAPGFPGGLNAAKKLVDELVVLEGKTDRTATIVMRRLPVRGGAHGNADQLRAALRSASAPKPLDELRLQNQDLIATLESIQAQREELVQLNAELEETNRGVMAMYAHLEDELDETNRGVVALYAELDDKTQRLNEASEAKSRFLASVSHELRSPVNSILGLVRLLLDPAADETTADQRKQLSLTLGSAKDLLALVNDLLDLAKAESGRLVPEVAPVDVADVFTELRGSLRPMTRPGVELIIDAVSLPAMETDRTLLAQVLRNLLTNALKFTTSGSVRLSARLTGQVEIEFSVSDTGIGVAPEDCDRIFEEFYQVRGPMQVDFKGTGLGLPYARRVAQALGGRLSLESELGLGSTFTVTLPTKWQALLNTGQSPARRDSGGIRVGTVLVVDDDEGFRTVVRGLLQGVAAQVLEARDGVEGLAMMRSAKPDIVFMDLKMPNMDGADVMGAMADDPPLRDIPVVIVTSNELDAANRPVLGAAVALLAKSGVTRESLAGAVEKALSA